MTPPAPTQAPHSASPVRAAPLTALLALAHFIVSVDFNIVYIALPAIGRSLDFAPGGLQWTVSAFALAYGGLLLAGGRAADRLGARRIFTAGLLLFAAASALGALALSAEALIAARAGQGAGAALLFPATLALIGRSFPAGPQRARAMAAWGAAGAFGALAGGGVGGILTSTFGWRSVFVALLPLALAALLGAARLIGPDPARTRGAAPPIPVGTVLVSVGAALLVYGLVSGPEHGWLSLHGAGALAAGLAVLAAFAAVERRSTDPLLSRRLLRTRGPLVAAGLIFLLMGPVNALHYLYTDYLQGTLGYSALAAGAGFLPQGLVAMAGSALLLPRLTARWGLRASLLATVLGVAVTSAAFALGIAFGDSYWALPPALILLGATAGTAYPLIFSAAGTGVASDEQGVASATASTAQQIGGAVGLAALLAVASAAPGTAGLQAAAWAAAAVAGAAALLALLLPRR